jgi:hypothetical protein
LDLGEVEIEDVSDMVDGEVGWRNLILLPRVRMRSLGRRQERRSAEPGLARRHLGQVPTIPAIGITGVRVDDHPS